MSRGMGWGDSEAQNSVSEWLKVFSCGLWIMMKSVSPQVPCLPACHYTSDYDNNDNIVCMCVWCLYDNASTHHILICQRTLSARCKTETCSLAGVAISQILNNNQMYFFHLGPVMIRV